MAAQLGIPHYVFNFTEEFDAAVVDPYVAAIRGRSHAESRASSATARSSSARLLERASALGLRRRRHRSPRARRAPTADGARGCAAAPIRAKDQSYVLYMLGQRELARTCFPVGELTKAEVRAHAARLGLRTAAKPESMDVCFITRGGRRSFLAERIRARAGDVVDGAGAVVGQHDGVAAFTVGQRRGLGVAVGERRYVVDVDAAHRDGHDRHAAAISCATRVDAARRHVRRR